MAEIPENDLAIRKFQRELNSGAVSLLLLTILDQLDRAAYGYEISKLLQARVSQSQDSGESPPMSLPMNQAAIYPVLRSLEKQSLVESQMRPSDSGPPRKYYSLTEAGRRALGHWKIVWSQTTSFVDSILENQDVPTGDPVAKVSSTVERSSGRRVPSSTGTSDQKKSGRRS